MEEYKLAISTRRLKENTEKDVTLEFKSEKNGFEVLLNQSINFRDYFALNDFFSDLILCFATTALDIGNDFNFAR